MKNFLMDILFKIQIWYRKLSKNDKIIFYALFFFICLLFLIFTKDIWFALLGGGFIFGLFYFLIKLKV